MKIFCWCQNWQEEDLVRTEFAHWSIDKLETRQEINEIGTRIICALNFMQNFDYLSSAYRAQLI